MVAAIGPRHRLTGRRWLRLTDLARDPWLIAVRGGLIERACLAAGFEPRVAYITDDPLAINGLVAADLTVTLTSRMLAGAVSRDLGSAPARRSGLESDLLRHAADQRSPADGAVPGFDASRELVSLGNNRRGDAEGRLRSAARLGLRLDEREQRMAGVVGGDGVRGGRRAGDRDAEAAVRVAALPRVGEGGRQPVPAAVGDVERLCPAWRRPRSSVAPSARGWRRLPRPGRRGSRRPWRCPWHRWHGRRIRGSGRRPWRRVCRSASSRRGPTCSAHLPRRSGTTGSRSRSRPSPTRFRSSRSVACLAGSSRPPPAARCSTGLSSGRLTTAGVATLSASWDAAPTVAWTTASRAWPGVGGRDGVRARGRSGERRAEPPVRVAALPLVADRGRSRAPAAGRDLERLALLGRAGDRRLAGRDELGASGPRPVRRGSRTRSSFPSVSVARTAEAERLADVLRDERVRAARGAVDRLAVRAGRVAAVPLVGVLDRARSRTTTPRRRSAACPAGSTDGRRAAAPELSGPGTRRRPACRRRSAVATLKTACDAAPARACTIATSAWPRSPGATTCVSAVAPSIGAHARPASLQRAHW